MELKHYDCAICGNNKNSPLYFINNFHIVECVNCKFVYVNPRLPNDALHQIYLNNYFSSDSESHGYKDYELTAQLRIATFKHWTNHIQLFVNKGNVLDIGCASGYFLELMRDKGWQVEAIELDAKMIAKVKAKNIPVFEKPFEQFVSDKKYQLITLFDVLEHIPDLKTTFEKLNYLLADDGVVALITPNYASAQRKLFRKKWFQFKPKEHIHYFTPDTLKKAIVPYGLEVISITASGQYADTSFLLNRLDKYNFKLLKSVAVFLTSILKLKNKYWYMDTGSLFAIIKKKK